MHIGIELRQIVPEECGGIVNYLTSLLGSLFRQYPKHQFTLFCTPANRELFASSLPNAHTLTLSPDHYFYLLDQFLRDGRVDVLFRTFPMDVATEFPLSKQVFLIVDILHLYHPEFFAPEALRFRQAGFEQALREAGAIVGLSEFCVGRIRARPGIGCRDVSVVPAALRDDFPTDGCVSLSEGERALLPKHDYFLYPANIWPHKNHRRLLQAFELFLRRSGRRYELILAGHPDGWSELERDFPGLPVRHCGYLQPHVLSALYQRAQAITLFSLWECFSLPVLEGCAAGVPVVCGNTTSFSEVGGDAIRACDPTDVDAMCELMIEVSGNEPLRQELVRRGKQRLANFSRQRSARRLMASFQRVQRRSQGRLALLRAVKRCLVSSVRARVRPRLGTLYQHLPRPLDLSLCGQPPSVPEPAPPIALVTPSWNQGAFLERTIKSVLLQRYLRLEYVVQDAGSTDHTQALLTCYGDSVSQAISKKDRGQAHAVNCGFAKVKGDIMAFLNSDDILLPGALACVARYFSEHPDVDVVYSHRLIINAHDQEVGRWLLPPHDSAVLSWADYIPQETVFWRRRIWERSGGALDESFQFALDWDLLLRFRDAGAQFVRLPRFLAAFRVHGGQKTSAQLSSVGQEEMDRIRQRCHGRPVTPQEIQSHIRGYVGRHIVVDSLHRLHVNGRVADGLLAGPVVARNLVRKAGGWLFPSLLAGAANQIGRYKPLSSIVALHRIGLAKDDSQVRQPVPADAATINLERSECYRETHGH
jgi:glycosyltransferase involved in cell wall biosynthesis